MPSAPAGADEASPSFADLEQSLDRAIERLGAGQPTREARALLIEARRLRSVVGNWRSIPPPALVHDEMADRVHQISAAVGVASPAPRTPAAGAEAPAPTPEEAAPTSADEPPPDGSAYDDDETEAYAIDFEPRMYTLDGGGAAPRQALPRPSLAMEVPDAAAKGRKPLSDPAPPAREAPAPAPPAPVVEAPAPTGRDEGIAPAPRAAPTTSIVARAAPLPEPVDPLLAALVDPYSPRADAYRAIRRKLGAGAARVLGVTSALPGEGKTVFAVNLALSLREGARGRVLLVEANLRSPGMARLLGLGAPECFVAQLARHAEDPRAPWVVAEPLPKLHVLAIDPAARHDPLLDPVAFAAGMKHLEQAGYEYIVVDAPPVLGGVDANVVADAVDGMILTALPLKSLRRQMRKAVLQLEPAPILGVVVLDV